MGNSHLTKILGEMMAPCRPKPLVSIVTVVWNNLDGLKLTAQNISDQSYSNIEHVVIDGGSADGTPRWLDSYNPAYSVTLVSEPDDGLYDAMNKGLRKAKGDIVVFLNGGDTFTQPDVVEFVAKEWSAGLWKWGYGAINYISAERNVLSQFHLEPFDARAVQLGRSYVPHPSTFMSREILTELGGFRPEFGWSADQELGVRAALLEAPAVWSRTLTDFLVGGAHSQGSLRQVARRYAKIRAANGVQVLGSPVADKLYTEALGTYWTARAWASARFKRRTGIDAIRTS
ncbi:glycosyltransferase family 2 protein [Arthrobacter sp. SAFR-014]|uniref:glycosyltransferase family 2 protein n=1 Tax=unclassified Arthrobacter TaxID=235627 RepID=UPI003F7BDEB2